MADDTAPAPPAAEASEQVKATETSNVETPAADTVKDQKTLKADDGEDDDDDDWDDDVLDEFSNKDKGPATSEPLLSSNPSVPPQLPIDAAFDDEFTKALQADLGGSDPDSDFAKVMAAIADNPEAKRELEELTKQLASSGIDFDDIMKDAEIAEKQEAEMAAQGTVPKLAGDASFQDKIRRTMENLEEGGRKAGEQASKSAEEDMLETLMRALAEGGGDPNADLPVSDEDIQKFFGNMFTQLSEKELMYEPMKELDDKYKGWIEARESTLSAEDKARYTQQRDIVKEIVAKYENPKWSDDDPEQRAWVWEKMQQMQSTGNPPEDLVENPMPGMFGGGASDNPEMPECPQQ